MNKPDLGCQKPFIFAVKDKGEWRKCVSMDDLECNESISGILTLEKNINENSL